MNTIQRQTDRDAANKAYSTYLQERQTRLNRFLTPEQQRTWREMTGDPFEFRFQTSGNINNPNPPKR
jgi:hypothetical protein